MKGTAIAACLAALLVTGCKAQAQSVQASATGIYYGDPEGKAPATVRMQACFDVIPEWNDIVRLKLTTEDADYWILLKSANERFHKGVESVAKAKSYDLVAEQGTLAVPEGEDPPPDATADVIEAIKAVLEKKDK